MRKILRIASLLAFLIFCACRGYAQGSPGLTIKGTVTDESGGSLPGVTVSVKNSKVVVTTDVNGKYTIDAPATGILDFTSVGMETQEVSIGGRTLINVTLKISTTNLANVVVIGYGTQKRGDVNGAIGSITSADIADIPQSSVDQMLQGKIAGVTITQNS